jgi:hypothetical protein
VTRLLIYLAVFALGMMLLAAVLGLRLGDLRAAKAEFDRNQAELASLEARSGDHGKIEALRQRQMVLAEQIRSVDPHWLSGVAAAIAVLLANSIVVTYFIGTNRWCKEVVDAYSLGRGYVAESTALKRRAFPWALLGMLSVIGVAVDGDWFHRGGFLCSMDARGCPPCAHRSRDARGGADSCGARLASLAE